MKRFLSILALQLLLLLSLTMSSLSPAFAQQEESNLPPGCAELIGDTAGPNQEAFFSEVSDEIIVLLSEGITSSEGKSISCSEVIYCLRKKYESYVNPEGKRITNTINERDQLVISYLQQGPNKDKYAGCYVSGKDGLDLLNNYARLVYQWIAGVVGSVCIMIIIFSGIQISLGGVNPDDVQAAKDRISRSLIGLVVLFLSALILYTINPLFFG